MTATTWNPLVHLGHAWSRLHTIWGKIGLVLFYSFIWLGVLSISWSILYPGSQGMQCLIDSQEDPWSQALYVSLLRSLNIFGLGFLLYADTGGLHFKNVGFVTIFIAGGNLTGYFGFSAARDAATSHSDCFMPLYIRMWVSIVWIVVAFVCTVLEERLGDRGTAAENQPLA
jgi:hypothetical protein